MKGFDISITATFSHVVRDYMHEPPPVVHPETPCEALVRTLREKRASSVVVVDGRRPVGIITEQDVTRRIAFLCAASTPASEVMASPLQTIQEDDYLYHGIARMHRLNLRHLPVVDRRGHLCGMLHLHDAVTEALGRLVNLIERLTHEETLAGLKQVKEAQVEVAEALLRDRIPAPEIQALLTHVNNDIYRRIVTMVRRDLHEEGWGEPPVEFDLIVMGSGGRGESFLFPDQDNGLILAEYPDSSHNAVDAYFSELALRTSERLHEVGIPRCRGYVMAWNPLWRKSLRQWATQINYWLARPQATMLRLVDIFFDFSHVYGNPDLATALRRHLTRTAKRHPGFLREMQHIQQEHGVALGLFGRLSQIEEHGPHRGKINLKYHGLLPLVESVRLLALREGISQTATLDRIAVLYERAIIDRDEQDYLSSAFTLLTRLILTQQISDFRAGQEVGPYVAPKRLSERERDLLTDSLQAINSLRNRLRTEFTADIF